MLAASTTPIVTAAISAAAALAGVLLGALATARRERRARDDAARRDLNAAALRVLARARKLEQTKGSESEFQYLGSDLDTYVVAIAGGPDRAERRRHWKIYERASSILIDRKLDRLGALVAELERVRAELMEQELREETRP